MSGKDYNPAPQPLIAALAKGLKLTRPKIAAYRPQWEKDIAVVAGVLKSFNASLDRARFFKECGVTDEEKKGEKP